MIFRLGAHQLFVPPTRVGFFAPWSITAFEHAADSPLVIVIGYDPGRIPAEEAETFFRCFQELVQHVPEAADFALGVLPLVSADERRELLQRGQAERVGLPDGATLTTLIDCQAARSPDATAVFCGSERLTYSELHDRVDPLAQWLNGFGVGPDTLVAICLPRTTALIIAVVAVHKSGGAFLPLDPTYPQPRLKFMIEDSNIKFILTDRSHAALLSETGARLLLLEDFQENIQERSTLEPKRGPDPSHVAYVLYTSGSTGTPKAVAVTHRNAVNLVISARNLINRSDISGVLCATSLNFDISVYEIFLPLASGGAIILVDDLFGLTTAPARDQVTLVNTVPSVLAAFLKEATLPVGVRVVNLAGESLSRSLADQSLNIGAMCASLTFMDQLRRPCIRRGQTSTVMTAGLLLLECR